MINATKGSTLLSSKKVNTIESSFIPPIGLLYIARSLEDEGHYVEVIDYYHEQNPDEQIMKSLASIDAIGLCLYTGNYQKLSTIASVIKNKDQDIPIIVGGPHCTFHPENILQNIPPADISIEGEGVEWCSVQQFRGSDIIFITVVVIILQL